MQTTAQFTPPLDQAGHDAGRDQAFDALERILGSADLIASDRNRRFLRYVVEEALAGRANNLKGYTIAADVFGRDATFNAQTDPLVRVAAQQLRQSPPPKSSLSRQGNSIRSAGWILAASLAMVAAVLAFNSMP
jgi:hypothetical protein